MATAIRFLHWEDISPTIHGFDRARAQAVASKALAGVMDGRERLQVDVNKVEAAFDHAFLAEFGPWAAGWRWAASEPGGGGPIRGWCCPRDSLFRPNETDEASATRATAALVEWRSFIEELAGIYGELPEARDPSVATDVEQAAARLLPLIVKRTSGEDAWYCTFGLVLLWYLESKGHAAPRVRPVIQSVIGARFTSWVTPPPPAQVEACRALGVEVANAPPPSVNDDATSEWMRHREVAFDRFPGSYNQRPLEHDGHRRFIAGPERARDPARAEAMDVALDACRMSAAAGDELDFARLAAWQAIVLRVPEVKFRTTDAFAKGGRERYPIDGAEKHFLGCLEQAQDRTSPVAVRAARVYLDVCFFHPFPDGNARAARLALDHVLARDGLGVHTMEPIVLLSRSAIDRRGAWYLAYLVDYLSGRLVRPPR